MTHGASKAPCFILIRCPSNCNPAMPDALSLPVWPLLAALLGLLTPWGISRLLPEQRTSPFRGLTPLLAVLLAVIGYAATGFALHFGGIGILIDHPDVSNLVWEWTPLRGSQAALWGVAGWAGFGMNAAETPLAAMLFISTLPLVITTTLLSMMALGKQNRGMTSLLFAAAIPFFLAPLAGNWTQAGGWLMRLDASMGAGAGYLDFGGASFLLLAGGVALAAMLANRGAQAPIIGDAPSFTGGAGLLLAGGVGWLIASPLHLWMATTPVQVALNGLLAAAAGGLVTLLYGWFISEAPDPAWTGRGLLGGWVSILALADIVNPWQALLVGAVAAWLVILADYFIENLLDWRDPGAIFTTIGLPAAWGVLAAGLFAPMPGQLKAQALGVAAIFLLAFFVTSIFLILVGLLARAPIPASERSSSQKGETPLAEA